MYLLYQARRQVFVRGGGGGGVLFKVRWKDGHNLDDYTTMTVLIINKNHLKMVQGCRIDTGSCKKPLSKNDSPKTLGTRLSCKTGTGLGGQRARQA